MANVDIRVGKKDAVFFSANPTLILKDGQFLFNSDTLELFIGDGTSQLSALVAINVPPSSGVQSVTGPQVDDTDPNNPIVNPLGLIKIVDLNGDFFTDLATASAYIATFNVAGIISDESYYPIGSGGIYYFTVPQGSDFSGADYFLAKTSAITTTSIIDDLGLITNFANYAFRRSNNKIKLGDCTFGDNAFYLGGAEIKLGDCTFGDNAFFNLYKEVTIGNITLTNPSYFFAKNSVGKFYIDKKIGASTSAEYPNFFSTSLATIFARKVAYTNNAGGIEGDLQTAIANGADVQFEGINLEKVSNKSTSIVTDQASNIKYPSVKSVYDWAVSVFTTTAAVATQITTALTGYLTSSAAASTYAPIASPTFTGTVTTPAIIVSSETASRVAIIDASKNVKSADTATYPSLTELSYAKGVTSAIQTQLDAKLAKASNLSDLANSLTARVNLGVIDIHITTGDQTTTSNAASNITDLVSPTLTINSRYKINGLIRVGCNGTGGVKLQITIPTGATMSVISDGNTSGSGGRAFNNITTSATLFTTPVGTVNSVNSYAQISGEISIGATSGTIQFGFASTTNTQLSSIYQLGTNITLIKIT